MVRTTRRILGLRIGRHRQIRKKTGICVQESEKKAALCMAVYRRQNVRNNADRLQKYRAQSIKEGAEGYHPCHIQPIWADFAFALGTGAAAV